ncbi:hypothetical protein AU476_27765 [Cupriavidus sp. UYMSc13B]|nr:hypothetical protein AU476_27765 [Cupriavidus sp. UYMSc13B]
MEVAAEVVNAVAPANHESGRYKGQIVAAHGHFVVQDVGRGLGVIHDRRQFEDPPRLGATVRVAYGRGRGKAEEQARAQMSLGLE